MTRNRRSQSLLTLRSAVIIMIGLQAAAVTGILTYLAGNRLATAALAGAMAFGGAIAFAQSSIS